MWRRESFGGGDGDGCNSSPDAKVRVRGPSFTLFTLRSELELLPRNRSREWTRRSVRNMVKNTADRPQPLLFKTFFSGFQRFKIRFTPTSTRTLSCCVSLSIFQNSRPHQHVTSKSVTLGDVVIERRTLRFLLRVPMYPCVIWDACESFIRGCRHLVGANGLPSIITIRRSFAS
jgi:hypothetical protein